MTITPVFEMGAVFVVATVVIALIEVFAGVFWVELFLPLGIAQIISALGLPCTMYEAYGLLPACLAFIICLILTVLEIVIPSKLEDAAISRFPWV